ncbi:transmembrane protein, putative (macronuclear) [Tetrahymena thermophila SB210]|uniref:Transmembrane protein, putative n=1 Tax=Tetrahymena thermophila (strain SB210) TaxID=312017 RepID=Q23CK9_TETTS|nr:transmembrane protein, putative [Tetrahymena thermophila SB210]EAR94271.2 transmembrane protein, putative [Tetrahymena thermophila SB210]|eukprot:XP_001014516.2 transmembrane protein, putative [Tetrahymena thermophila SB210]
MKQSSRKSIMSLSVEAQKQIIIKEFQKLKVSSTQKLNKDELFQILDKKLGKQYDRSIANQLIDKLDTDEDGKFQASQFFSIVIEASQTLQDKIEQNRDFLQELTQKRKNVYKKYEEEMQKEKKNEYNIMEGSIFSIKPIKILSIDKKIMKDEDRTYLKEEYYVKVICDKYSDNVAWDQTSSFPIKTSTEDIFVALFKTDGDEPVAKTDLIQLNGLRDQKKVQSDVYMNSFDGKKKQFYQIQLELQWIHSKTEIYEEIIQDWDNQIRQNEEDLNGYQNDLIILLEPFPGLSSIIKQMESQQENFQFESTSGMNLNTRELKNRNSFTYDSNILIPSSQQSIQVQDVFKTLGYSNFAYMIMALILSYERVLTLDMLICMSYFIEIYTKGEYNVNNFKSYSLVTIASITFDIIWLVLFTVKWWSDEIPNQNLQRAVVVLSCIYLALKIYLSSLYLYLYRDYSKNPEQKLQDNMTFHSSPKASFAIQENIAVPGI